jgi:hypothetical protein
MCTGKNLVLPAKSKDVYWRPPRSLKFENVNVYIPFSIRECAVYFKQPVFSQVVDICLLQNVTKYLHELYNIPTLAWVLKQKIMSSSQPANLSSWFYLRIKKPVYQYSTW